MPKKSFFTYDSSQGALCAGHPADPVAGNGWRFNTTTQTCDWRVDQIAYRGCAGCSALNLSTCECDMNWLTSWERVQQVPGTYFCEVYTPSFATMTSECAAADPDGSGIYCKDVSGHTVPCTGSTARWRFEVPNPSVPSNVNLAGQFGGCVQRFTWGNYAGSFIGWSVSQAWDRHLCPSGLVNTSLSPSASGNYQAFKTRAVDASGNASSYAGGIFRQLSPLTSNRITGQSGYYTINSYGGPSGVVATTVYGCYWDPDEPLNWGGLATNVLGGRQYYPDGVCKGVVNSPACMGGYTYTSSYPPLSGTYTGPVCYQETQQYIIGTWSSCCRGPYGMLYSAYSNAAPTGTAGITVQIFNDSLPEGVASSRTVESSGAPKTGSASLSCRSSGILDLVYIRYNVAASGSPYQVRYVYSRNSGRSWEPAKPSGSYQVTTDAYATGTSGHLLLTPIQLTTGYQRVVHHLDDRAGRMVLLLWREDAWYIRVATDEGTDNWNVSEEHLLAAGDPSTATLQQGGDGSYTVTFWDLSGSATYLRCKDLSSDGSGQWE